MQNYWLLQNKLLFVNQALKRFTLFSVAPIPTRNIICPAPRDATRLTRIWDKGPFMSLIKKEIDNMLYIFVFAASDWSQLAPEANAGDLFRCKWHKSCFNDPPPGWASIASYLQNNTENTKCYIKQIEFKLMFLLLKYLVTAVW